MQGSGIGAYAWPPTYIGGYLDFVLSGLIKHNPINHLLAT